MVLALVLTLFAAALPLADAQALLDDKRPTEALASLEQTVAEGALREEQLVLAYELMGRAYGMLGRGQQAQRAFAHALRVSPSWRLGDVDDPQVKGPYEAALTSLPPAAEALLATVTLADKGGQRGVLARLVADDSDLVAGARVLQDGAALTTLPLSLGEPEVFYPLPPEGTSRTLELQLTDAYGNELERLPVSLVIERTTTTTSASGATTAGTDGEPAELRWLALSGGTLLGLGVVGVTAAGIWFAAVDGGDVEAPAGAREVGLVGVGVATGVILLGGALVVLDFVLAPTE